MLMPCLVAPRITVCNVPPAGHERRLNPDGKERQFLQQKLCDVTRYVTRAADVLALQRTHVPFESSAKVSQ